MVTHARSFVILGVLTAFCVSGTYVPATNFAYGGTWFGIQGSISGDTYLVGQRFGDCPAGSSDDVGGVHVFDRAGSTYSESTTLESLLAPSFPDDPGDLSVGAEFGGGAVLLDGDTAVVGAYRNTVGGQLQAGNAFVFARSGSTWTKQAVLQMPGGAVENARFAASGDFDSDRLILSAQGTGGAYVFTRTGSTWDSGVELLGGNIDTPNGVSISGDLATVGNFGENPHVDLWRYNEGFWGFETAISNPGAVGNLLGASVDICGNTMVVAARQETVADTVGAGAVYVYEYADETWSLRQTIENPSPGINDEFGYDVSIDGNRMAIGVPRDDTNGNDAGIAYVYERLTVDADWTVEGVYAADSPAAGKWFGEFVDLSENMLLVGGSGRTAAEQGDGDACWFELAAPPMPPQYPGDANRDGHVNEVDLAILTENWLTEPADWADGDFNGDDRVDDVDATMMMANWQWTWTPTDASATSTVPEPGVFALLASLIYTFFFWRREK